MGKFLKKKIWYREKIWYIFLSLIVLWVLLNVFLFIKTLSYNSMQSIPVLFPFNYRSEPGLWAYDFTEFIGYAFVIPYLVSSYLKKYLFFSEKPLIFNICFSIFFIVYCNFILLFLIISNNNDIAFLLLSTIGGVVLFLFSMYITEIFLSQFPCFNKKKE